MNISQQATSGLKTVQTFSVYDILREAVSAQDECLSSTLFNQERFPPFPCEVSGPKMRGGVLLGRINAPFPREVGGQKMRGGVLCGRIVAPDARRVGAQSGFRCHLVAPFFARNRACV